MDIFSPRVVVTCDVFFGPHRQETELPQPKATQENDALVRMRWVDSQVQQQVSGEDAESRERGRELDVECSNDVERVETKRKEELRVNRHKQLQNE